LMIFTAIFVIIDFLRGKKSIFDLIPSWLVPLFSVFGLGIAIYLTIIEVTHAKAICGPIGSCNLVQQSQYAYLFGIIPIGIIGIFGYSFILFLYILHILGPKKYRKILGFIIWILAWFGLLFSVYLTFLEPFVIGATCIWCITSALIITLLVVASTKGAKTFWSSLETDIDADGS
jgi:uncharacterized membrane protein